MTLTDLLRRYLDSGAPDVELLMELRKLVRERLRQAQMWEHPPTYFGYPEYHHWKEAFAGDDPSPGPVGDFFIEEIAREVSFFSATLRAGNNVDALLRQKVKWFLIDRQKRNDPVGYRAFMNLVGAAQAMIAAGVATATGLVRGKIRNPTILQLTAAGTAPPATEQDLVKALDADPEWLPALLRLSKLGLGAQALLRARLEQFPSHGIAGFLVGQFGNLLKERARAAAEAWGRIVPDDRENFRTEEPRQGYFTSAEVLARFRERVRTGVAQAPHTDKVKRGMLFVLEDWLRYLGSGQEPPQVREWAAQLGLSKSSLSDYQQRLRSLMRAALDRPEMD